MDLTETIAPRSDQLNADDLMAGPVTVTIQEVTRGTAEQPVNVNLVEYPGRPYKPSKSMRRVMVAGWGKDATAYAGRSLTLFRNSDIKFGRDTVGGIEIAEMSHLDKPLSVPLTVTRGKRKNFTVKPLTTPAPAAAADKNTGRDIPQEIVATIQRITTAQEMNDYFAWLTEQGAGPHILNYVSDQITTKENQ